ncbi:MAG: thiamine pyrophosphate-binding protein [Actinomycetota bacterium]
MTDPAARLAAAIARGGARHAFGVPGGGPNLDVVGALEAHGIDFVLAHTETAASIMASTYGYLSGSPTAAVVTRGPGAASAVNGAAQATLDRHPLVLVTDTVPASTRDRVPHQRIDQKAMLGPVVKDSMVLGEQTGVDDLLAVVATAGRSPAGCIHLDYDAGAPGDHRTTSEERSDVGDTAAARDLIDAAESPVVVIGLGANESAEAVRAAVELFGAPVLATYQGVGVVDSESDLHGGLFTNGASERALLERADLIVLVGVDFVEPIPAPWIYEAPVLSISSWPAEDGYLPIDVELVGDPGQLVPRVLTGDHGWPTDAGRQHRESVRSELRGAGPPDVFGPVELVRACSGRAPHRLTTTVDAGAHFLAIMPFWPVHEPTRLLISNGLATMGYAVPAAIGASLARPGEPVLALTGDGGLGMCLAELETIVRQRLPITTVVFNDAALSLIEIKQHDGHGGSAAVRYAPTDFAAIAAGVGMPSILVEETSEVLGALSVADGGPLLVDARIDPSAYGDLIRITRG